MRGYNGNIYYRKDSNTTMKNLFNIDNKFFTFMAKVADLMILNIYWLICSLPIVTLGASTSALYYSTLKIARKEDTYPTRMFFHSFKQNLKQGTGLTLIFLFFGAFLYFDIQIVRVMEGLMGKILSIVFLVLAVVLCMIASYAFPLLAQFDNTIKNTIRNSFLMCISHLPATIIVTLLSAVPAANFILLPYEFFSILPFWAVIGIALIALVNSHLFVHIFIRYMPSEEEESESTEETDLSESIEDLVEANPAGIQLTPIPGLQEPESTDVSADPTASDEA